jgi:hypothetical protein
LLLSGQKIRVGTTRAILLKRQIQEDSRFLMNMGIIDYSLLIGVHYPLEPDPTTFNKKTENDTEQLSDAEKDNAENAEKDEKGEDGEAAGARSSIERAKKTHQRFRSQIPIDTVRNNGCAVLRCLMLSLSPPLLPMFQRVVLR